MLRIKNSIRLKIAVIVFFSTLLTILISWSISNHFIAKYYVSHTKSLLVETYKSCNSLEQVSKAYKALSIANELANDFNNYVEAHKNELNPEVLKEYPLEEIS